MIPNKMMGIYTKEKITCRIGTVNELWLNEMETCIFIRQGAKEQTMKNQSRKLSKEEREMQSLLKKLKKSPKKVMKPYVDPTTRRDDDNLEDALQLFKEMKKRDF